MRACRAAARVRWYLRVGACRKQTGFSRMYFYFVSWGSSFKALKSPLYGSTYHPGADASTMQLTEFLRALLSWSFMLESAVQFQSLQNAGDFLHRVIMPSSLKAEQTGEVAEPQAGEPQIVCVACNEMDLIDPAA